MGEEESTKVEVEGVAGTAAHPPPAERVKDLAKDKFHDSLIILHEQNTKHLQMHLCIHTNWMIDIIRALRSSRAYNFFIIVKNLCITSSSPATEAAATKKTSSGSIDRDAVLARVETEKRESMIKAWEENEKTKAQNKAAKKMASITAWENSKKAAIEAELKMKEVRNYKQLIAAQRKQAYFNKQLGIS
ncbi:hypothetical protein C4D60_Mb11t03700 [Musa balbisiana]|uniref:Remorin C-terminal domain-containing protein n=1 Tax=Musa balbisiana TaxID=52838 RepID=A0A4V4H596_MUSBA|nr:hypothetical protein C4D60_Mb11t03700 [Musa balbisiana]